MHGRHHRRLRPPCRVADCCGVCTDCCVYVCVWQAEGGQDQELDALDEEANLPLEELLARWGGGGEGARVGVVVVVGGGSYGAVRREGAGRGVEGAR